MVLPAVDDAADAQHAHELHEPKELEDAQQIGPHQAVKRAARRGGDAANEQIKREAGEHIVRKPAAQVMAADDTRVIDHSATLRRRQPKRQEELDHDVGEEDCVHDSIQREIDRSNVEISAAVVEANLKRCDQSGEDERERGDNVPASNEAPLRIDGAPGYAVDSRLHALHLSKESLPLSFLRLAYQPSGPRVPHEAVLHLLDRFAAAADVSRISAPTALLHAENGVQSCLRRLPFEAPVQASWRCRQTRADSSRGAIHRAARWRPLSSALTLLWELTACGWAGYQRSM